MFTSLRVNIPVLLAIPVVQLKKRVNANAEGMTTVLVVKRATVKMAKIANVVFVIVFLPISILSNSAYKTKP